MPIRLDDLWAASELPAWCRVVYDSAAPVEFGVAATDALHNGDGWTDVRRAVGEHDELPEVVLELDDVVVSARGGIWKAGDAVSGKAWGVNRDGQAPAMNPAATSLTAELSGTHGSIIMPPPAFGHWLLHRLPRLHSLRTTIAPPRVLSTEMPYNDQPFFDCFSYGPESVHRLRRGHRETAAVERLVLTTHLAKPSGDRRIDSPRLATLVDDLDRRWSAALEGPDSPTDVYITRRDRNGDRDGCRNRAELEHYFADRGYTIVFPPDLSLPEQFALFRRAQSVVGEMGSGMHWALACTPGTSVTYITPRSGAKGQPFDINSKSWMRAIADARGLHFAQIVATPSSVRQRWPADLDRVNEAWSSRPESVAPHSPRQLRGPR